MKHLSINSLLFVLLMLSSGCKLKPDHPQYEQEFSERKAPVENILVSEGFFSDNSYMHKYSFKPYQGPLSNKVAAKNSTLVDPLEALKKAQEATNTVDTNAILGAVANSLISKNLPSVTSPNMNAEQLKSIAKLAAEEQGSKPATKNTNYYEIAEPIPTKPFIASDIKVPDAPSNNIILQQALEQNDRELMEVQHLLAVPSVEAKH